MRIIQAIKAAIFKAAIFKAVLVDLVARSIEPVKVPEPTVKTLFMQRPQMPESRCEIGTHRKMNVPKTRSQLKSGPQCRSTKIYTMASF